MGNLVTELRVRIPVMPVGLLAAALLLFASPQGPDLQKVIAKVDGQPIKAADIAPSLWEWYAAPVVQDFIISKVIENEARRLKIVASEAEILQTVNAQLEQLKPQIPEGKTLDQYLLEQGSPKSKLIFRARIDSLLSKIASASFKPEDFVNVSTLVIRAKSTDLADVSKAIEKANAAYEKLKKGDPWLRVLGEYSGDPAVLNTEGRLGWRTYEMFPESTQKELKSIKPRQVTKPIQTVNGFQIFRLEYRGNEAAAGEQALLRDQVVSTNRKKILDQLMKNARIERF